MTTADPTPVRGSWRLSLQELAERAGAPVERLERLVELGILAPADTEEPFRSGDILRVRAVTALEGSGVQPEQIAAAMKAGELSLAIWTMSCNRHRSWIERTQRSPTIWRSPSMSLSASSWPSAFLSRFRTSKHAKTMRQSCAA